MKRTLQGVRVLKPFTIVTTVTASSVLAWVTWPNHYSKRKLLNHCSSSSSSCCNWSLLINWLLTLSVTWNYCGSSLGVLRQEEWGAQILHPVQLRQEYSDKRSEEHWGSAAEHGGLRPEDRDERTRVYGGIKPSKPNVRDLGKSGTVTNRMHQIRG